MVIETTSKNGDLRGVVAIGASAGGVEALSSVAAGLSPDLPYAYLMVLHIPPDAPSVLAHIVDRNGSLPAVTAEHGASLEPAHIYVASPDRHLLVGDHRGVRSQGADREWTSTGDQCVVPLGCADIRAPCRRDPDVGCAR
jgi:two-component system chemotaxis response regulator CheB